MLGIYSVNDKWLAWLTKEAAPCVARSAVHVTSSVPSQRYERLRGRSRRWADNTPVVC